MVKFNGSDTDLVINYAGGVMEHYLAAVTATADFLAFRTTPLGLS